MRRRDCLKLFGLSLGGLAAGATAKMTGTAKLAVANEETGDHMEWVTEQLPSVTMRKQGQRSLRDEWDTSKTTNASSVLKSYPKDWKNYDFTYSDLSREDLIRRIKEAQAKLKFISPADNATEYTKLLEYHRQCSMRSMGREFEDRLWRRRQQPLQDDQSRYQQLYDLTYNYLVMDKRRVLLSATT